MKKLKLYFYRLFSFLPLFKRIQMRRTKRTILSKISQAKTALNEARSALNEILDDENFGEMEKVVIDGVIKDSEKNESHLETLKSSINDVRIRRFDQ